MFESIRKTALTVYGKIGTDWVRMTAARTDVGTLFVRADGSNAVVPVLPVTFRTSGDIVNVAAQLGHRVNLAAVPSVALPNHVWKGTLTLEEAAEKFGCPAIVAELTAFYASVDQEQAA